MGINAPAYGRRDFLKGATAAGAAALAGTGILARAEVLPDEGGERDGKARDGQEGKALDF